MQPQFKDKFGTPIHVGDLIAYVDMSKSVDIRRVVGVTSSGKRLKTIEQEGQKPMAINLPQCCIVLSGLGDPEVLWDVQQDKYK